MHCAVSRIPPACVITVTGRWDAFSSELFEQFWEEMDRGQKPRLVVLDLRDLEYISSFGLRDLLNLGRQLENRGGAVHVAALSPAVNRVFLGSGLASLFPAFADAASAAAAFTQQP